MADQEKLGRPWSDDEIDAIIADYFAMLGDEIAGRPYVKSHHSAALMSQIGRTHRSVEFKHQNISAVLDELGMPWIPGYKPKRNYQQALLDGIERYLSLRRDLQYEQSEPVVLMAADESPVFVQPPELTTPPERPVMLERLVRKFDPVERDFRNRKLGRSGEAFVVEVERRRLIRLERPDLAKRIRWVAEEDGDGAGYDILSFEPGGKERLIEVKTTNGAARTPFFLTRNEKEIAESRADAWQLYRVHDFARSPRIFTLMPPLESIVHLRPEVWQASFSA